MTRSPMHSPFAAAPVRWRWLTLPTAAALAGDMLASRSAVAAAGGTLGSQATAISLDFLNFGAIATIVLYLVAAFALIAGVVGVWQLGRRNQQVSPMVPICAFLAAFIAAGAGTWMALGSTTITGAAPSITGASTQPIQFQ